MKRRFLNILAAFSLVLLATTLYLRYFSPRHWVEFELFHHPLFVSIDPRSYGICVRVAAAKTTLMPLPAGLNRKDPRGLTGCDVGSIVRHFFGMYWGSGYTISNITPNSPNILPARTWLQVQFSYLYPIILFALSAGVFLYCGLKTRGQKSSGHCAQCGYDLRATPDRCPECGTVPTKINLVPR